MVVHKTRARDHLIEIGVVAAVVAVHAQRLCHRNIFGGIEHVEVTVHPFELHVAFVRNLEAAPRAFLGLHLYDTRGSARAVHGCFGGVLQDAETLNVGRIDGRKRKHIGCDTVYQHQGVVAAYDGRGAAHAHTVEHGHTVETVGRDVDTGCLAVQHVKGIVHSALGGTVLRHLYDAVSDVGGILQYRRVMHLCMRRRTRTGPQ